MLDDLRNSAQSSFDQEDHSPQTPQAQKFQSDRGHFLGMTAGQRFVIVLMLLLMTCIMGTFCLLIFEKISLPFF
jgi:hypothetical protein